MANRYQGFSPVDFARAASTTLADHITTLEEAFMRNFQMGALLEAAGRITYNNGGRGFDWPVQYRLHNVEGNTGETVRSFARRNLFKTAQLENRGYQVSDAMYYREFLENRGPGGFVWVENYTALFRDSHSLSSFKTTAFFATLVATSGILISLLLATMVDSVIKGALVYKTFLIWPYAVAPAIAGVLWAFIFAPSIGIVTYYLKVLGFDWNWIIDAEQAKAPVLRHRLGVEADQLQLPLLPRRAAVDSQVADRGGGHRRGGAFAALLDHRAAAAVADHLLPAGDQHRLRLLRHLRRDRRHHAGRPGAGDPDPRVQGLSRRRQPIFAPAANCSWR